MAAWFERNSRVVLASLGGVMVVAGLAWWGLFYQARYTIAATPPSATVTVDGTVVVTGQRIKLKPGRHTLAVTLNDFIPFTQEIRATSGQYKTFPVTLVSLPHLQPITRDRTIGAAIDPTTSTVRYVNQSSGRAEQVTIATGAKPTPAVGLSPAGSISHVDEWLWGPTFDLGLFRTGDRWKLYSFNRADLLHQSTTDWPSGVGSVSWHPISTANSKGQSNTLVHFNAPSDGEQTLMETDPLHAAVSRLVDLRGSGVNSPVVKWVGVGDDVVLLSKDGRLWRFVVYTRSLTAITQSETVDGFTASPSGQVILAHTANDHLFTIGIDGKNKHELAETGSLAGVAWAPDSTAIWLATTSKGLAIDRIVVATDAATSYAVASDDSIGTLSSTLVTSDEKLLILAGSGGLASLALVPQAYPSVSSK